MSTPPSRPLPPPRAGDNDPILLSPLMTLMPTGYRNIQPFQKGKGWHTNGRTPRHRAASTQASQDIDVDQHGSVSDKERGVVFPLLPGHEHVRPGTQGPDASAVEGAAATSSNGDQMDDRQEKDEAATVISQRAPSTPPANGAPRRPSRSDPGSTLEVFVLVRCLDLLVTRLGLRRQQRLQVTRTSRVEEQRTARRWLGPIQLLCSSCGRNMRRVHTL